MSDFCNLPGTDAYVLKAPGGGDCPNYQCSGGAAMPKSIGTLSKLNCFLTCKPVPLPPTPPLPGGFTWAAVSESATKADLPARAVAEGGTNAGGAKFMCRASVEGKESNVTGSVSYAGAPQPALAHCRVACAGAAYAVSHAFEVMVAPVDASGKPVPVVWVAATTGAKTAAGLPAGAVVGGANSGGETFVCRGKNAGGEVDTTGSVLFDSGSAICRCSSAGHYYEETVFEVMVIIQ